MVPAMRARSVVRSWIPVATETGGILLTPLPGATPLQPGSARFPFFGVKPVLLDAQSGERIEGNGVSGVLAMEEPWPGQMRTVYGDHKRFEDTYFDQYKGYYFTGDGCRRDEDGYSGSPATWMM